MTARGRHSGRRELAARRLDITTVGKFSLSVGGTPLRIVSRKANALIGYLAINETSEETRERLVGLFWSEVSEANARASLRQVLHEIRAVFQAAGFDGLQADKRSIALEQARIKVDLHEIVEMAQAGKVHPRFRETARLPETLLVGFEDVDSGLPTLASGQASGIARPAAVGLRDGDAIRRAGVGAGVGARSRDHVARSHSRGGLSGADFRASAGRGDFGVAMRLYKSLWDLLDQEFDVEPSAETQALIVEVRNATVVGAGRKLLPPTRQLLAPGGTGATGGTRSRSEHRRLRFLRHAGGSALHRERISATTRGEPRALP